MKNEEFKARLKEYKILEYDQIEIKNAIKRLENDMANDLMEMKKILNIHGSVDEKEIEENFLRAHPGNSIKQLLNKKLKEIEAKIESL